MKKVKKKSYFRILSRIYKRSIVTRLYSNLWTVVLFTKLDYHMSLYRSNLSKIQIPNLKTYISQHCIKFHPVWNGPNHNNILQITKVNET